MTLGHKERMKYPGYILVFDVVRLNWNRDNLTSFERRGYGVPAKVVFKFLSY